MQARVLSAIYVFLATATVAQSKRWFAPEVNCWITQQKVPASWEEAQRRCKIDGALLASPLNTRLFNYMQSRINVHNHSTAYFIGTRAKRFEGGQEVDYVSVEGRRLEDLPMAVFDAIEQLDLEQGDCLAMDRLGIRAVSCWDNLPYICYSNETMECGLASTNKASTTLSPPTTTTSTPLPTSTIPPTSTSKASTTVSPPTTTTSTPLPTSTIPPTSTSKASTTVSPPTTITSTPLPTSTIPPRYTYYAATGSYYKFHKSRMSWHVANTTCASEGAHLVVVNNAEEADIIARIVKDAVGYYWIWTGLRDNRPGGVMEWRTVHGEPLSDVYHLWWLSQPQNDAGRTCADFGTYSKGLYDESCDRLLYFTCEMSR